MAKITRTCLQCGKEFLTYESSIKKGKGKFCSISCGTKYRNLYSNPTKDPEVRKKISEHHADVSGSRNPMYGRRGKEAPSYVDGLHLIHPRRYRAILLSSDRPMCCIYCGTTERLHVHHIDGDHKNENLDNLVWVCIRCHTLKAHKHNRDKLGRFCT